jgi:hypothetical protein
MSSSEFVKVDMWATTSSALSSRSAGVSKPALASLLRKLIYINWVDGAIDLLKVSGRRNTFLGGIYNFDR